MRFLYFCNGKDPSCNKSICYALNKGECCYTTNQECRLTPIQVDSIELKTRMVQLDPNTFIEVFENKIFANNFNNSDTYNGETGQI